MDPNRIPDMPHDTLFEQRIAGTLKALGAKAEPKKMFGGVAFMVNGNMTVGITNKSDLMVRFNADEHDKITKRPGARPMTFTHREMKGFLFVDADAVEDPRALEQWVKLSLDYVYTLPKKNATDKKPGTKKRKAKKGAGGG